MTLRTVAASVALAGLLCLSACGGNKSTWQLLIKTPPGDSLFSMGVSQVRLTVGDNSQSASVSSGQFSVSLDIDNPMTDQYIRIKLEALDTAGQVVARGISPNVVLTASDSSNTQLTLFVARRSKVSATPVSLIGDDMKTPAGRVGLSAVALRGRAVTPVAQTSLGVLITGGADASGAISALSWLYDPLTHSLLSAGSPKTARRGAVLVPTADANIGEQALLFGGQDKSGAVQTSAELFDPQVATLDVVFTSPASDIAGAPGSIGAAVTEVTSGVFLASGGTDKDGNALPVATLLQRFPPATGSTDTTTRPGVKGYSATQQDQGPMVVARAGHSATAVTLKDGPGALLFGGVGAPDPLAETFSLTGGSFAKLSLTGDAAAPRRDHVAFPLRDGRVLVAGGRGQDDKPLASALLISPTDGAVEARPSFLQVARSQAGVAVFGDEILICGGQGDSGPLATCEIFTQDLIAAKGPGRLENMPRPRVGPQLVPLETGNLLFIGGTGAGGVPVAEIDAYTAP